jgi:hypothetical protein
MSRGTATAWALTGATAILSGVCSAQAAADYASNPTYAGGWSAGQNGGSGFGPWSFNGSDMTPSGQYQGISTAAPLGTAWTLLTHSTTNGLANAGRAIPGGLQVGQTFETLIDNPTTYNFFRGWDVSFMNATDNNPGGVNTARLYLNVFGYGGLPNWTITDNAASSTTSTVSPATAAIAGLKIDLILTSANAYSLTLTPLSNPSAAYTHSGTLAGSGPVDWVDFRLYNGPSGGLNDTANNLGISYMTIVPEPSTFALVGMGFGGLIFLRRRK